MIGDDIRRNSGVLFLFDGGPFVCEIAFRLEIWSVFVEVFIIFSYFFVN